MNRFLSITNLILWALFGLQSPLFAEPLTLPGIRQEGAKLSPSVANEADHALRQSLLWLKRNPPASTETQMCALVQLAVESAAPSTNLMTLVDVAGLSSRTNGANALLVDTIVAYPLVSADPETLWLLSHAINQNRKGLLLRKTEVLDWRNDFAQLLLSSLRTDVSGGAYWEPAQQTNLCQEASSCAVHPQETNSVACSTNNQALMTARIRATAFGYLALKEIHE
jgi:hypothetical protein